MLQKDLHCCIVGYPVSELPPEVRFRFPVFLGLLQYEPGFFTPRVEFFFKCGRLLLPKN